MDVKNVIYQVGLKELKVKINIFDILFLDDRGKNQQSLHDLEISPAKRKEIIT
ncbi:MAG: hypothetical protein KAR07_06700 [Spirochaetes bacterium]|nr:hypothetical protein [Spirochaetota bacterium]